jgi:hypothetical protein
MKSYVASVSLSAWNHHHSQRRAPHSIRLVREASRLIGSSLPSVTPSTGAQRLGNSQKLALGKVWCLPSNPRRPDRPAPSATRGSARRCLLRRSMPLSPATRPRARPSCAIWSTRRSASKHWAQRSTNPARVCIGCSRRAAIRAPRTSSTSFARCRRRRASDCASRRRRLGPGAEG